MRICYPPQATREEPEPALPKIWRNCRLVMPEMRPGLIRLHACGSEVRDGPSYRYRTDWRINRQPAAIIQLTLSGRCAVRNEVTGATALLTTGQAALWLAHRHALTIGYAGEPLELLWIILRGGVAEAFADEFVTVHGHCAELPVQDRAIHEVLSFLATSGAQEHTLSALQSHHLGHQILTHLAPIRNSSTAQQAQLVDEACTTMLAHLADSNVEIIAAEAGISRRHLTELFKHYRDATPGAWLRQQRLQHAQSLLLRQPNDEIKDIAEACGFHSVSHFAQLFSKSFGCSPHTWRQQHFFT